MSIISSYKLLANENHENILYDKFLSTIHLLDRSVSERELLVFYNRVITTYGGFDWKSFQLIFNPYFKGQQKYGTDQ